MCGLVGLGTQFFTCIVKIVFQQSLEKLWAPTVESDMCIWISAVLHLPLVVCYIKFYSCCLKEAHCVDGIDLTLFHYLCFFGTVHTDHVVTVVHLQRKHSHIHMGCCTEYSDGEHCISKLQLSDSDSVFQYYCKKNHWLEFFDRKVAQLNRTNC